MIGSRILFLFSLLDVGKLSSYPKHQHLTPSSAQSISLLLAEIATTDFQTISFTNSLTALPCATTTRCQESIAMRTLGRTPETLESAICCRMRTNLPHSWTKKRPPPTLISTQRGLPGKRERERMLTYRLPVHPPVLMMLSQRAQEK